MPLYVRAQLTGQLLLEPLEWTATKIGKWVLHIFWVEEVLTKTTCYRSGLILVRERWLHVTVYKNILKNHAFWHLLKANWRGGWVQFRPERERRLWRPGQHEMLNIFRQQKPIDNENQPGTSSLWTSSNECISSSYPERMAFSNTM